MLQIKFDWIWTTIAIKSFKIIVLLLKTFLGSLVGNVYVLQQSSF